MVTTSSASPETRRDETASGEKTSMSPLNDCGCFSMPATGLVGSPQIDCARRKTPCRTTSSLFFVRLVSCGGSDFRQRSIIASVTSSSRASPNAGIRRPQLSGIRATSRLAAPVVLGVAQVLGRGVGERRAGADHAGQGAPPCGVERLPQPVLSEPLGEVAGGRTAAFGPGRSELLLHLSAVGQPVFRVTTSAPARAGPDTRVRKGVVPAVPSTRAPPSLRPSWDILGTYWTGELPARNAKTRDLPGFADAPERIRTSDLRFRRPTLYPAELRAQRRSD
jgi:hypothetical protein